MPTGKPPVKRGRSEVWTRGPTARAIKRELRRLGERLRELRLEQGLTQEQAAEAIGVHPKHIIKMEQGAANVTVATLVAASAAFKVPLRDLFREAEKEDGEK
ncbi:XRE family transcriptional regulator [Corallococcus sp. CA041A]|uniref:helix-turn-helix domain-containing protein n=1 Tax=Corallococcus sp. CA041A TaxID=2316727 RepID=UPI000EA1DA01|nr:helix-turn-helix transcriptional regulator [Corallococcus sp. CA041A]RKH29767.1 XRE family transcriptional regulator [Corallococcus sp. CA041A]